MKKVNIKTVDFKNVAKKASKDDLVYFDPPYTTSHKNNSFIEYNSKIFSLKDQMRLKNVIVKLDKKDCTVIISNADHPYIKELYKGFNINVIERKSVIASDIKRRKEVTELIITNF